MVRLRHPRLLAVLAVLALAALPVVSGYLDPSIYLTDYVEELTCGPCHGNETSDNVTVLVDVPTQVAYTPDNASVMVGIGVLGEPSDITSFGFLLNASEDPSNVQWEAKLGNKAGQEPVSSAKVQVNATDNGSVLYTVEPLRLDWFNVSFIPGNANQTLELSVIGMNSDESNDDTGDPWTLVEGIMITVRQQRLMKLNVTVSNSQPVSAGMVLVDFYIDGEYMGNDTINDVTANGDADATLEWDVTFVEDGEYSLRAVIDPQGVITELDKDNNEVTRTIWLGGPPEEETSPWVYVGALVAVLVVLGVVYMIYRRRLYRF